MNVANGPNYYAVTRDGVRCNTQMLQQASWDWDRSIPGVGSLSCETLVGVAMALAAFTVPLCCCEAAACCTRAVLICEASSTVWAEHRPPQRSSRAATSGRTWVLAICADLIGVSHQLPCP